MMTLEGLPLFAAPEKPRPLSQEDRLFLWMMARGELGLTTVELLSGLNDYDQKPLYCANYTGRLSDGHMLRGHRYRAVQMEGTMQHRYFYEGHIGDPEIMLKPEVRRGLQAWRLKHGWGVRL